MSVKTYRLLPASSSRNSAPVLAWHSSASVTAPQEANVLAICSSSSTRSVTITEVHRKALPRALRLPEDTASPMSRLPRRQRRTNRIVHAEILVVLRDGFDQPALVPGKEREILDEVQQPRRLAQTAQHDLQRHPPRLVLALDPLPLREPIPVRRQ